MSQYPSPYYPPNVQPPYLPYAGPTDFLAPARRASLIMFIIGGLLTLLGVCNLVHVLTASMDQEIESFRHYQAMQGGTVQFDDRMIRACLIVSKILVAIVGFVYLALAIGVRRGGKISTIFSLVLTSIIMAILGLMLLVMIIMSLQAPTELFSVLILMIPTGIMVPLMVKLIQSLRMLPRLANAQQQYMAQYWQYQQNMQAYQGYGYAGAPLQGQVYQPQPNPPLSPTLPPAADQAPPPPTTGS